MSIAWDLAGGGSRGIVQFGMIKRVHEAGLKPKTIFGTSVGSLNGAGYCQGDLEKMEWVWMHLDNRHVRRFAPLNLLRHGFACLYDYKPMREGLEQFIKPDTLKACPIDFRITVTSTLTNRALRLPMTGPSMTSDPVTALLASCSPPGLVPPVNGTLYDGGLTDNYNAEEAIQSGASHIIIMVPSSPGRWQIRTIEDALDIAISIPIWSNFQRQLDSLRNMPDDKRPKLTVIKPTSALGMSIFDFDYKGFDRKGLIQLGYDLAARALG